MVTLKTRVHYCLCLFCLFSRRGIRPSTFTWEHHTVSATQVAQRTQEKQWGEAHRHGGPPSLFGRIVEPLLLDLDCTRLALLPLDRLPAGSSAHLEEGHQALHLHLRSTTRSVQHR